MRHPDSSDRKSVLLSPDRREPVVWMRGVTRYFDINNRLGRALTEISFEVDRGEVFGLLGPSGSGKSTTLRILAGRLPHSEGKARVFGRHPQRRPTRIRVGYLPQRQSHDQPRFVAQVIRRLSFASMWRRKTPASTPVDLLPANQRLSLLKQALAGNPELLLLDEPFSGFDAARCVEMKDLILGLARRGRTVILTSDSLTHAKDVCDRVAVYYAGKIEAIGTLDEILATREALRTTGPILPQETAQRLLRTLREDLGCPVVTAEPSPLISQAPLAMANPAALNAESASNEVQGQVPAPIDNELLAVLTKPARTTLPHSPG